MLKLCMLEKTQIYGSFFRLTCNNAINMNTVYETNIISQNKNKLCVNKTIIKTTKFKYMYNCVVRTVLMRDDQVLL